MVDDLLRSSTVVFVASYLNHLRCFLPIIDRLRTEQGTRCILVVPEDITIGEEKIVAVAEERNIELLRMRTHPYNKSRPEFSKSEKLMFNNYYLYFYLKKQVKILMAELMPDILVVGHDQNHPERYFLRIAKNNGIPSLLVAHAISTDYGLTIRARAPWWSSKTYLAPYEKAEKPSMFNVLTGIYRLFLTRVLKHPLEKYSASYGGGEATLIAYWGDYQKNVWVNRGGDPDKMVVAGYPGYDVLHEKYKRFDNKEKEQLLSKLRLPNNNKIVLFTTQSTVEEGLETLDDRKRFTLSIVEEVLKIKDVKLIVKVHPKQKVAEYDHLKSISKDRILVIQDFELHDLVLLSDVLVTKSSTTAMDAILCNTPVVTVEFQGQAESYPYASSGAAVGVENQGDLKQIVEKVLFDEQTKNELKKNRERFVGEHVYKFDGKATERVIGLIEELLKKDSSKGGSIS